MTDELRDRIAPPDGEVERLRKYAQHLPDCGWRAATCGCLERTCPFKEKPCTCGLDAALSGSKEYGEKLGEKILGAENLNPDVYERDHGLTEWGSGAL
jgi:hypothetical protein